MLTHHAYCSTSAFIAAACVRCRSSRVRSNIATAERAGAFEIASRASDQIEFADAGNPTYCEEFGHGLQPKS
jgi:hypothetical protein